MNELILNHNINNEINTNKNIEIEQKNFFQTSIGKIVNNGIDIGLKTILPDVIEDDIIDIKNTLINEGFKSALDETINKTLEIGKEIVGIFTGDIKDASKIKKILESGKLINRISNLLDSGIEKLEDTGAINKNIINIIKEGKKNIINIIKDNVDINCKNQEEGIKEINNNIEKWQKAYNNKNYNKMEKYYEKINEKLKEYIEIEDTIIKARQVENIHNLIKNNGKNFNLSKEEIEAAKTLIF